MERKDVVVKAVPAQAFFGGHAPSMVLHVCPICKEPMPFVQLLEHGRPCADAHPEYVEAVMGKDWRWTTQ